MITYGLWIELNGFQRMNEPELDYEQRVNNGGRRPLSTSYSTLRCHVKKYEAEKAMPDPLLEIVWLAHSPLSLSPGAPSDEEFVFEELER